MKSKIKLLELELKTFKKIIKIQQTYINSLEIIIDNLGAKYED